MANAIHDLQFAGRRREASGPQAQAMGRSPAYMAGGFAQSGGPQPTGSANPPDPCGWTPDAGFAAAQPNYPPPQSKRGMAKGLAIALGAAAGLVLILFIAGVFAPLSGKVTETGGDPPASQGARTASSLAPAAESSASTAAPARSSAPAQSPPQVSAPPAAPVVPAANGDEFLYTGYMECAQAETLQLSFVLSADLSYIHDIKIEITDLDASVKDNIKTTTVNVSNLTETYSGDYPVDFEDGGFDIPIDRGFIRSVYFYDDCAFVELDYVYYGTDFGSNGDIEIPLDTIYGELTTDFAPEPASAGLEESSSETFPTKTVFDYAKLKNWNKELGPGGVYAFTPASPRPRYYIVCANTVTDPKTGSESAGGYEKSYTRHKPVSTDDVLRRSGELNDGGLTLTDDPGLATYALIVTFAYDHTGNFKFSDGSNATQYHGTTKAELYNMVTGESIYTSGLNTYATYANESVYTTMLNNAKGKQLYAQSHTVGASDFSDYWSFIEN